jgi:hypothetical protein
MKPLRRAGGLPGLVALIALAPWGCGGAGDDLPREPISGTVAFEGQPLQSGTIQFQPASAKEGVAAGGMITAGRFDVPRKDGPVPGKYHVMIFALEGPELPRPEGEMPGVPKAQKKGTPVPIPPRYNFQTELSAEVKAGGQNTYTFDLKK